MIITEKQIDQQFNSLNDLQKTAVQGVVKIILKDKLATAKMKNTIAGIILFTNLDEYDG